MPRRCVVGAGVAGIQAIRALRAKGFEVDCFEMSDNVGGVWRENYQHFGVQVPKQLYEFTDLEFTETPFNDYPTGEAAQAYIERYTDHFDLNRHIKLNTKVNGVKQLDDGSWNVDIAGSGEQAYDKLVICSGLYGGHNKNIPEAKGQGDFAGDIIHTHDYRDEKVKGKKVVVVGNGKSAVEVATFCSDAGAESVTLLSRQTHWPTPQKIANIIPFQHVFLSRLGQALVIGLRGPLPGSSPAVMSAWHALGWPVMAGAFKVVELLFAAQYGNLTGPTSPFLKQSVVSDFYGYGCVLNYTMRDKVKSGEIDWQVGEIESFGEGGVTTKKGETTDADVVIYGTGFKKNYSIFDSEMQEKLNIESDGMYLYRNTTHLDIPNLAFVGSELATIMNITSYGIQAAWLGKLWKGEISYDQQEAKAEVDAIKAWKRAWMPDTPARASLILLHQTHFHDRLLKDMGISHRRRGANVLAELFCAQASSHYDGVIPEASK